jgi:ribosomal protein S12 methylthiotransferase accessory factor
MRHAPVVSSASAPRPAPAVVTVAGRDAAKTLRRGTHRSQPLEHTLARALPVARAIGVTRLADITHLDRVGIPTVLAVRPGGGWLSVDAGKGLTTAAATASAAMECIERHHAETARLEAFDATWDELDADGLVAPVADLPLARAGLFARGATERWAWTWDVAADAPLAVPAVTLGGQPRRGRWDGERLDVQVTSNGLASGNDLLEAICSGLCELIERDAVACWGRRQRVARRPPVRVDPAVLEWEAAHGLLARFAAAGLETIVLDVTADVAVPTFGAYLFDRHARHAGYFRGFGTHLDPQVALARALTEAAQSRAIVVAGSRDDVFWADLVRTRRRDDAVAYERLRDLAPTPGAGCHADASTATFAGDLDVLLQRLAAAGLHRVGVLDLSREGEGLAVVRAVVPGLEGYETTGYYAPGHRARAFAGR